MGASLSALKQDRARSVVCRRGGKRKGCRREGVFAVGVEGKEGRRGALSSAVTRGSPSGCRRSRRR